MIPSKSVFALFIAIACFQVQIHPESITPVEVHNSNQEQAKLLINQLDEALGELTKRFPDNVTDDEFDEIIADSFKKFYEYITATKPKAQVHAIIMYLQYAELIFKHGATSRQLQLKDHDTKEAFFELFLMCWEDLLGDALDPMTESLYNVITSPSK